LRLEKAIQKLEFIVSIDIYLNETNRNADIILPVAVGLESSNYDVIFQALAIRNTTKYSPALFPKGEEQRYDWEVIKAITQKLMDMPDNGFTPELILDQMLQNGYYGKEGLSLQKLKENPHGIDLGALRPCILERLQTDDELIDIAPGLFVVDLNRLEKTYFDEAAESKNYPFALIGRRNLRQHNTWTHNSDRLKRGRNQCTLLLHPDDAESIGIKNGEMIQVNSNVGSVCVEAEISSKQACK